MLGKKWEALAADVNIVVSEAAAKTRNIRRGKDQLIRDILVLIAGLRPSILIDYLVLKQGVLHSILRRLGPAIHTFQPGKKPSPLQE